MTEYAIRADGLAKSFGRTRALRDFSLRVPPGSVCALLGRNGAGKTTTVRILTTLFASASVAVAVATDMSEGVIDRFRSLPITRSSVLVGRTVSTVIVGLPSLAVMICCALAVGWRAGNGLPSAVAGFVVLELFGFSMGWVGSVIGLYAKSPRSADVLSMTPAFLLGFVSNVFVNTANMPA